MKKNIILLVTSLFVLTSCKTDKKQEQTQPEKELTILEKVANAHGYEHWKDVSSIKFTFNVDRDSSHFERTWLWKPKTNAVIFTTREDTIAYNRIDVDSIIAKTDGGFINDKFWLLAPYQLVWDNANFTYEHQESAEAPISKTNMQKLTIVYGEKGGYTPGDAYDFYFGDDFLLKEWVFRKANQEEPSMITSWEDYEKTNGMVISKMHKKPEGNFQLYFTSLELEME